MHVRRANADGALGCLLSPLRNTDCMSFPWIFGFGCSSAFRAQDDLDAGLCQKRELNGFIPD